MIMLGPNAKFAVEIDNTQGTSAAMRMPASGLTPSHPRSPQCARAFASSSPACARC